MAMHVIEPLRETLHSTFSRDLPPALTIDSEDTVVFSTLEAGWGLEPSRENGERRRFEDFRPEWRGDGHALCGPVEVRGARHDSGDTHRRAVDRNLGQDGFRGPIQRSRTSVLAWPPDEPGLHQTHPPRAAT